jgi:ketosteroid isomerase-like protein
MSSDDVNRTQSIQLQDIDLVELFAAGPEAAAAAFPAHPDIETEFIAQISDLEALTYQGVDGFVAGWADWLGPWSSYKVTLVEVIPAGENQVVALSHAQARTSHDGVLIEHDPAAILTFRDGLIARARFFMDGADALAAAGVSRAGT